MSDQIRAALNKLTETVRSAPQASLSVFRASTISEADTLVTQSEIRGFTVTMDEPLDLGGTDTGPNPVEMVLAALGSCQEIVYRAYASMLGLEIERIEVHAKGRIDLRGLLNLADVPSGFSQVSFTTRIISDEPHERIRDLAELVERHCPVMDTLMRAVEVTGKVEVQNSGADAAAVAVILPELPVG